MKRVIWLLPLLLLLLACGPTTSTFPSADAPVNTAVSTPTDSDETGQETAVASAAESGTTSDAPPAVGLDEFVPMATVEEAAQVRPQDWRKGSTEPAVVIIEYGDFQ